MYIQDARAGERTWRTFTLLADGNAIDLSDKTVSLYIQAIDGGPWRTYATDDAVPELVITDASAGEITIKPSAQFWRAGRQRFYFTVAATPPYNVPNTDFVLVNVGQGV